MNLTELRKKTEQELQADVIKLKSELEKFNLGLLSGKEKNIKKRVSMKKDIAQALTVINEKRFMSKLGK